ncbi:Sec-independent protein translocase protein TatB [Falsirhodobacter sp. 20TX0035]|uniref:Sec-independent protein translocase protein TatB n=1 Tax=Falsirhodobacter sp. 20TX0035 TaxID=3022019 RepID=UPI00232CC666|nr:Sec-independent protein translocase protein TatB [Falsirhodobacter sp. 20TX0035]MDB6454346.1 Sec-independent protein translocase protein TatB [Falsirhodobacter sp. 20TX0035]
MFDIGWSELILIGTIALIVVGPKDLPDMFRQMGRFTSKARSMAREFSNAMEDAAKESGVGDVAGDLKKMTSPRALGLDAVKTAATKFENWDPMRSTRFGDTKADEVRHSAASVTAAPPVAEALKPVLPAVPAKSVAEPKLVRPRPEPVRRRKVDASAPVRKPVPRRSTPKKPET